MYVAEAPTFTEITSRVAPGGLTKVLGAARVDGHGDYVHWDRLRHLEPPDGLTHDEWWLAIKLARQPLLRPIPLTDPPGRRFV